MIKSKKTGQTAITYFLLLVSMFYSLYSPTGALALDYSNLGKFSFRNNVLVHKLEIKSGIVYKVNTAEGYVSVITLPVIPLDVAMGDTQAFSEQTVGRQIFIKPITYDRNASSNLEIYTKYGLINILLRISSPKLVTYDLNLAGNIDNVFTVNYIKKKIDILKRKLLKKYGAKFNLLKIERQRLKNEKQEVMNLILLINRVKIDKAKTKDGITATILSISRIKGICYLAYQITNNNDKKFFIKNIYLYRQNGGNFFNGYRPETSRGIYPINALPHNKEYPPYKIIKKVIIFKKSNLIRGGNLKFSAHIVLNRKLIKIKINRILN